MDKKERGEASGGVMGGVICELALIEMEIPFRLCGGKAFPDFTFERTVVTLNHAIRLGVVRGGSGLRDV